MAGTPSWLWLALGWALITVGAWPLLRGRLLSKRRRERRCGRCAYSMQGLDTLTCPECGKTAVGERALHTARGLKRWRAAGLLLAFAGWSALQVPAVLRDGVARSSPTWALAYLAPCHPEPRASSSSRSSAWATNFMPPTGPTSRTVLMREPSLGEQLSDEMWRRIGEGETAGHFARVFLSRAYEVNAGAVAQRVQYPACWPSDGPPSAAGTFNNASNSQPCTALWELMPRKDSKTTADVVITRRLYHIHTLGTFPVSVDLSRTRSEFLERVDSPELTESVARALQLWLRVDQGRFQVTYYGRSNGEIWDKIPYYLRFRVRLLINGEELAAGYGGWPGDYLQAANIDWPPGAMAHAIEQAENIDVEITGDPVAAVELYCLDWSHPPKAWSGTYRVRPQTVRIPGPPKP